MKKSNTFKVFLFTLFFVFWSYSCGEEKTEEPEENTCSPSLVNCNGTCVDLTTDINNCGSCGVECSSEQSCINGQCKLCTDEVCNGEDDDCDGEIDEGVKTTFYRDSDGDSYGDPEDFIEGCEAPSGYVDSSDDCDDSNGEVHPGATEICDGQDNDCNGIPDEGCECEEGETRPCGDWPEEGVCEPGTQTCEDGHWGECIGGVRPSGEECNGLDDDCDGRVDDGLPSDSYEDNNSCDMAIELETAFEVSAEDPPHELSDATIYLSDGSPDEDWFVINSDEATHTCVPMTSQCCFHFVLTLTPPEGMSEGDITLCAYTDGNCTDGFHQEFCTGPEVWDPGLGSYIMDLCWSGTCGLDDGKQFYVKVFSDSFSCKNYRMTYQFFMSDVTCEE